MVNKVHQHAGKYRRCDNEAIGGTLYESLLQQISNLRAGARHGAACPPGGYFARDLEQGEIGACSLGDDMLLRFLEGIIGRDQR